MTIPATRVNPAQEVMTFPRGFWFNDIHGNTEKVFYAEMGTSPELFWAMDDATKKGCIESAYTKPSAPLIISDQLNDLFK